MYIRNWAYWHNEIFDLSDYIYTLQRMNQASNYQFLDTQVSNLFKQQPGQDISKQMDTIFANYTTTTRDQTYACLKNNFYYGRVDFRDSPRCKVNNYILLSFSGVLCATILAKCKCGHHVRL
jgi:chitin synthase